MAKWNQFSHWPKVLDQPAAAVSLLMGRHRPRGNKDLAEPSGMPFKVAACFLYYMQVNMAFALTDALVNANSMLVALAFTDRPQSAVVTGS